MKTNDITYVQTRESERSPPPRGRTLEVLEDAFCRRELAMDHQTPPTRYWKGMRERRQLHRPQKWGGGRVEGAEEVLGK
jgi:hypothetical protein